MFVAARHLNSFSVFSGEVSSLAGRPYILIFGIFYDRADKNLTEPCLQSRLAIFCHWIANVKMETPVKIQLH